LQAVTAVVCRLARERFAGESASTAASRLWRKWPFGPHQFGHAFFSCAAPRHELKSRSVDAELT
ncbi:hypothetical protein BAE44_0010687, partial [Dichanthelium oligosanthes]